MYYNENNVWLYGKRFDQENVISRETSIGTNLINHLDSENNDVDIIDANESIIFDDYNPSEPNDNNSHHNQQNYYYNNNNNNTNNIINNYRRPSARSMSSSLPIQIPARQMSKDLSKLKLEAILKGVELKSKCTPTTQKSNNANVLDLKNTTPISGVTEKQYGLQGTQWVPATDELDEFFEQEFNDNHHSHYRVENEDHEQLRAEENPMELFHSIQALARSLHEDAELFGSLPPKRMLESPIRSLVQLHD